MSIYTQVENDILVIRRPCKLLSITITNTGSGEGRVDIFDGRSAHTPDKAVTCLVGAKESRQFSWKGLEFSRGLYVDNVDKVEFITIEWEPQE